MIYDVQSFEPFITVSYLLPGVLISVVEPRVREIDLFSSRALQTTPVDNPIAQQTDLVVLRFKKVCSETGRDGN